MSETPRTDQGDAGERCRLYAITPQKFDPVAFQDTLARTLDAGDVACLQLRLKDCGDNDWRRAIEHLMPIAQDRGVAFLVNDRPDLARDFDCDGVHVGAEDLDYESARRIVGDDRIVGVSCYDSRHLAMTHAEKGADYVGFGAFFPSTTKVSRGKPDLDLLEWWSGLMEVPCVAIGGITPENCRPLVEAGADFVCSISGLWDHPDGPEAAVRAFNAVFDAVESERAA